MCKTKTEAKAKMERLIESMDRFAAALSEKTQPITVNLFGAPPNTTVTETRDENGRRIDVLIDERVASATGRR